MKDMMAKAKAKKQEHEECIKQEDNEEPPIDNEKLESFNQDCAALAQQRYAEKQAGVEHSEQYDPFWKSEEEVAAEA